MKAQVSNDRPQMTVLEKGKRFKTLKVSAKGGMQMPSHHATEETVIVVLEGAGVLNFEDGDHALQAGESIIIPAGLAHKLTVLEDFKAVVIMPITGEIEF